MTSLLLVPYLPASTAVLLEALAEPARGLAELGSRGGGQRVEKLEPLFPKLEARD